MGIAGLAFALLLALTLWALWPALHHRPAEKAPVAEGALETLGCMVLLAEGDSTVTVVQAHTVCVEFQS
jgi:hypothetical protein